MASIDNLCILFLLSKKVYYRHVLQISPNIENKKENSQFCNYLHFEFFC